MNSMDNIENARPLGRVLRLLFSTLVFVVVVPYYFITLTNVLVQTVLVTLGLVAFYVLLDIPVNPRV